MKNLATLRVLTLLNLLCFFQISFAEGIPEFRLKPLLDKVATTPVSSADAKIAFKNGIREVCTINGVSTANGFGTTEECLSKVELSAHPACSAQLAVPVGNEYRTQEDLKAASRDYLRCAFKIIDVMKKQ